MSVKNVGFNKFHTKKSHWRSPNLILQSGLIIKMDKKIDRRKLSKDGIVLQDSSFEMRPRTPESAAFSAPHKQPFKTKSFSATLNLKQTKPAIPICWFHWYQETLSFFLEIHSLGLNFFSPGAHDSCLANKTVAGFLNKKLVFWDWINFSLLDLETFLDFVLC